MNTTTYTILTVPTDGKVTAAALIPDGEGTVVSVVVDGDNEVRAAKGLAEQEGWHLMDGDYDPAHLFRAWTEVRG